MKAAAATAGMVSAAMLLAPGCGREDERKARPSNEEPVRRAAFRSMIARDLLASCPGGGPRSASLRQAERHAELKQLALRKGAGHAIWLGENDHAGLGRHGERERCAAGEEPYREALAQYGGALDALAGRIAEYRE